MNCCKTLIRFLVVPAILLLVMGCGHVSHISSANHLASVNLWASPANPSLYIGLTSDRTLLLNEYFRGKGKTSTVKIDERQFEDLLSLIKATQEEIKTANSPANLADGSNIEIVIGGGNEGVTYKRYVPGFYSGMYLPLLYKKLEMVIPKDYWR